MFNIIPAILFTYLAAKKWRTVGSIMTSFSPDSYYFMGYCFLAGLFWGGVINWIL